MSHSAPDIAQLLSELPESEVKRALRQYEIRKVAKEEEEGFGELSTPLGVYRKMEIPIPPILVKPALVVRGGLTITIGRAGRGKTMMNLNRLLRWSAGTSMFKGLETLEPIEPMKILIVENEGAATMFQRKIRRMVDSSGFTNEQLQNVDSNLHIWGDGGYSGLKLDSNEGVLRLQHEMERTNADILFIEPLRSLHRGEENSSTEMANVLDTLVGIAADFQAGVIVSHHEKKGGMGDDQEFMDLARGSTAIEGAVDVMENFRSVKSGALRELSWSKNRYEPAAPVRMQWDHATHWYAHIPDSELGTEILTVLEGDSASVKDISTELGESETKVRRELSKMIEEDEPRIERFNVPGQGYMYRAKRNESEGLDY